MSDESEVRRTYLGGPAAATILGVNPYQTPLALWQFLTKRVPAQESSPEMRSGMLLEPVVLAYAGEELGRRILPGPFVRDSQRPLGGHIDGVVDQLPELVEAKTSRHRRDWGDSGTDEVPQHVAAQALHYLGLTDARICWIPVLFSGLEFALYKIERNDSLIATMQRMCVDWWNEYVVKDMPPPPVNGADAAALFPKDSGSVLIASDALAAAVSELRGVRSQIASLEESESRLEGTIKVAMGEAAVLSMNGEIAATWKTTKSSRFDSSTFKAAEPALYTQYCREQFSRRFLLK